MSIVARCSCGNRVSLVDALAGRTIPCPKCGNDISVPAASGVATAAAKRKTETGPSVAINPAILIGAGTLITVVIIVLAIVLGPWAVGKKWAAITPQANTEVTDVVLFALKAYESQHGMWDSAKSHNVPTLQGDAVFRSPGIAFSLPRKILFGGTTNQGHYEGHYDTVTGEIDANIEFGGWNIGGLLDARKPGGSFAMTGREKGGVTTAECDGQELAIIYHAPPARGQE